MKQHLLVTGGYGFVGSAFVNEARALCGITRIGRGHSDADIAWDLTHNAYPALPDADCIVHLASLTAKDTSDRTSLDEYRRQNVSGTKNLLAALTSTPSYVLYVSTADVYGHAAGEVITEETEVDPQTPYAVSKLEAEEAVAAYCTARGIAYGIARLGSIYGAGEAAYRKAIPTFISRALAGEPITIVGSGHAKRQHLYVDDAVRALLLMVEGRVQGILNVVGSKPISVAALGEIIVELSGHSAGVQRLASQGPEQDILFDPTRLSKLGFAEAVSLREGLSREIEWCRTS